jgi:hypothetical protein
VPVSDFWITTFQPAVLAITVPRLMFQILTCIIKQKNVHLTAILLIMYIHEWICYCDQSSSCSLKNWIVVLFGDYLK